VKRVWTAILIAAVLLTSTGAGVLAWLLTHDSGPAHPEVSAFSHGQMVRVEPFFYCDPLNLNNCDTPRAQGQLDVDDRHGPQTVQLSVPAEIAKAPWQLILAYDDPDNDQLLGFRPGEQLAVTIPIVDPQRGRLTGIAVHVPTIVMVDGQERELPHAEWSIRTVWPEAPLAQSPAPTR